MFRSVNGMARFPLQGPRSPRRVRVIAPTRRNLVLPNRRYCSPAHSLKLGRGSPEHEMRRAGSGPDWVELQQILIEQGQGLAQMPDWSNAADREAGRLLHPIRLGLPERDAEGRLGLCRIDPVRARGDDQDRAPGLLSLRTEHDRFGDLRHRAAHRLGRPPGGTSLGWNLDYGVRMTESGERRTHTLG